jgi:RNA polymerase-binding transcription factor DksA
MSDAKEKSSYSREELEEFRVIIQEKLAESRAEFKQLKDNLRSTTEANEEGFNPSEYGTEMSEKEHTEMLMSRTAKFIEALDRAMARIESGTYGRCKVTGKLIPKERLRLVPHTETSIEAKLQQNK